MSGLKYGEILKNHMLCLGEIMKFASLIGFPDLRYFISIKHFAKIGDKQI